MKFCIDVPTMAWQPPGFRKMINFAFKVMKFVFKMMNFAFNFCIINDEFCILNDELAGGSQLVPWWQ